MRAGAASAFPELAIPTAIAAEGIRSLRDAARGLADFAEGLAGANRRLAQYSGQIGMAYGMLAVHEFGRQMGMAREAAPTTVNLVRAIDEMRQEFMPYRVAGANVANLAGGAGAGFMAEMARNFAVVPGLIQTLIDRNDPNGSGAQGLGKRIADLFAAAVFGNPIAVAITEYLKSIPGIEQLIKDAQKRAEGMRNAKPALGPWDALLSEQARARSQPLAGHGLHGRAAAKALDEAAQMNAWRMV